MNKLTPRAFEQIGRDLFGHPWAESLARALDVPPKQPLRYAQGGVEIPRDVQLAMLYLAGHPEEAQAHGRPPPAEART